MSAIRFLVIILLFPFWLGFWIYWKLFGEKQAKKAQKKQEMKLTQLRKKWSKYLRNFDPSRLKNKTWQKSIGKHKQKPKKTTKNQLKTKKLK